MLRALVSCCPESYVQTDTRSRLSAVDACTSSDKGRAAVPGSEK